MKILISAIMLIFSSLAFCQNSTLLKNVNFRASELYHSLNKPGDSLLLKGQRIIKSVTFYNKNFEKAFIINDSIASIALHNLPVGRFATEVKLKNKLIILTLLRHKEIETGKTVAKKKSAFKNENSYQNKNISGFNGKADQINTERKVSYWIIYEINNGSNSRKMTRIGDKDAISKLIEQNKIDLKTKTGKNNELTIWEVYDISKFLKYKRRNPDYANASDVEFFNATPFYKS